MSVLGLDVKIVCGSIKKCKSHFRIWIHNTVWMRKLILSYCIRDDGHICWQNEAKEKIEWGKNGEESDIWKFNPGPQKPG